VFKRDSDNEQQQKSRALNERDELKTTKLRQFDIPVGVASHVNASPFMILINRAVMDQAPAVCASNGFRF
jgi:hypothetical protein